MLVASDERRVDAASVVADRDLDEGSTLRRTDLEPSGPRLAVANAFVRRLDPVIDGVAHQVNEHVGKLFEDRAVELRLGPGEDEVDVFLERVRRLANRAAQRPRDGRERLHPHT